MSHRQDVHGKGKAQNRPGALVPVSRQEVVRYEEKQISELKHSLGHDGPFFYAADGLVKGAFCHVGGLGMAGLMIAGGAAPLALIFSGMALVGGVVGSGAYKGLSAANLSHNIDEAKRKLHTDLRIMQKEAFAQKRQYLLAAADEHLESGGLLDMDDLAYLVSYNAEALQSASDQLAITVLQARKALAYDQYTKSQTMERRADGRPAIDTPLGFAELHFDSRHISHCYALRRRLEEDDPALDCDSVPSEWPVPDFSVLDEIDERINKDMALDKKSLTLRALAMPFYIARDVKDVRKARKMLQNCDFMPQVPVPALEPVEELGAAMAFYETAKWNNPPLDLPALRGWPHERAARQAARRLPNPNKPPI